MNKDSNSLRDLLQSYILYTHIAVLTPRVGLELVYQYGNEACFVLTLALA